MARIRANNASGGGGANITKVAGVNAIRDTAYTFPSTGRYLVLGCYYTTTNLTHDISNLTVTNATIKDYQYHKSNNATSIYMTELYVEVEVTGASATIQDNFASNAQAWIVMKVE